MFCARSALRTGTTEDRPFCKLRYDITEVLCLQVFFTIFFLHFGSSSSHGQRCGTGWQQPKAPSCSSHQKQEKYGQNPSGRPSDPPRKDRSSIRSQSPFQSQPQRPPAIQKRKGQQIEHTQNNIGPGKALLSYPYHYSGAKQVCKRACQNSQQFPPIRKLRGIRLYHRSQDPRAEFTDPASAKPQHRKVPQFMDCRAKQYAQQRTGPASPGKPPAQQQKSCGKPDLTPVPCRIHNRSD